KLVSGSYASFRTCGLMTNEFPTSNIVFPSGVARDTASVAMTVPPPGRSSITKGGPPDLPMWSANRRAIASLSPPAAYGITSLIERVVCANEPSLSSATRIAKATGAKANLTAHHRYSVRGRCKTVWRFMCSLHGATTRQNTLYCLTAHAKGSRKCLLLALLQH